MRLNTSKKDNSTSFSKALPLTPDTSTIASDSPPKTLKLSQSWITTSKTLPSPPRSPRMSSAKTMTIPRRPLRVTRHVREVNNLLSHRNDSLDLSGEVLLELIEAVKMPSPDSSNPRSNSENQRPSSSPKINKPATLKPLPKSPRPDPPLADSWKVRATRSESSVLLNANLAQNDAQKTPSSAHEAPQPFTKRPSLSPLRIDTSVTPSDKELSLNAALATAPPPTSRHPTSGQSLPGSPAFFSSFPRGLIGAKSKKALPLQPSSPIIHESDEMRSFASKIRKRLRQNHTLPANLDVSPVSPKDSERADTPSTIKPSSPKTIKRLPSLPILQLSHSREGALATEAAISAEAALSPNATPSTDPTSNFPEAAASLPSPSAKHTEQANIQDLVSSVQAIFEKQRQLPECPLSSPIDSNAIFTPLPLNASHFECWASHRKMRKSRNDVYPLACQVCGKKDREMRYNCTWCSVRLCHGCMELLAKTEKRDGKRSLRNILRT